jgi:hypothetical protein
MAVEAQVFDLDGKGQKSFLGALQDTVSERSKTTGELLSRLTSFLLAYEHILEAQGQDDLVDPAFHAIYNDIMLKTCDHLAQTFLEVEKQYPQSMDMQQVLSMLTALQDEQSQNEVVSGFQATGCPHMATLYMRKYKMQ